MTLDVICDVTISGDAASLDLIREGLKDTFEGSVSSTELACEGFQILQNSPGFIQVFFTTRYLAPVLAVKSIADKNPKLIFTLTHDDQIGNSGRVQFKDGVQSNLVYQGEFQSNLETLVEAGDLPPYGIIATGVDEEDLKSIVLRFAEDKGYESDDDPDDDEAWIALDWLVEEVGLDYGCFETEGLNFTFRPWDPSEL